MTSDVKLSITFIGSLEIVLGSFSTESFKIYEEGMFASFSLAKRISTMLLTQLESIILLQVMSPKWNFSFRVFNLVAVWFKIAAKHLHLRCFSNLSRILCCIVLCSNYINILNPHYRRYLGFPHLVSICLLCRCRLFLQFFGFLHLLAKWFRSSQMLQFLSCAG